MLIGRAHPRPPVGDPALFRCGHPRSPENATTIGRCAHCVRVRTIMRQLDRQIERWKHGRLTPRERALRRCA